MELMNIINEELLAIILIFLSVILDVIGNIYLKKSDGSRIKKYFYVALLCIAVAFLCLGKAFTIMELSVAYALSTSFGILLTTLVDRIFFGLKIKYEGVIGIFLILSGIFLMQQA